jgi:uncharacterized protein YggU (UPF0235/DUF167 family)
VPVRLQVRVHHGAQRPGLVGRLADGSLKVAVAEAPEGGRANRAVEVLVAGLLALRRTQVSVVGGAAARLKQVEVEGLDAAETERRLAAALEGVRGKRGRGAEHGE